MDWTEAQRQTIETRGKNILVSAAAGSGKTAVLIERIKRMVIEDKIDIDRFLITTFTNAASAEMKERLEKAIREEMKREGADKIFLKRQLSLLPGANISTFHTFALEIMRRYFYLTDLEPGFRIGDETEISIMKSEAVDELFQQRFDEDYDSFKEFLKKYSSDRNERRIKESVISLYGEMRSIPDYMEWADSRTELLNENSPCAALGVADFVAEESARALVEAYEAYRRAADIIDEAGIESLCEKAAADADMISAAIRELSADAPVDEKLEKLRMFLDGISFNRMRASKEYKEYYDEIKESVSALRKSGKKSIDDLKKKFFRRSLQEYDDEMRTLCDDTRYMTGLIRDFETIFHDKKAEKNMVDFDDVMHYAIDILKDDMAAAEYRDRFEYIFIDEFQDSNMLQEAIVARICREDNLFMVGDVKQSIYKFRLAEPEIFKRKYALYKSEAQQDSIKIDLNSNFRSKRSVTDTVNAVFEHIMDDYDEDASLKCSIDESLPGYGTELHILPKNGEEENAWNDVRYEELLTAELIRRALGSEIYDMKAGAFRKIGYRDIAVLSRNRSMISSMERYLNNEGIPAYGENAGGYFETVEIQVFVNLLRIIDNFEQDIPLISVMRCSIFDFDIMQLASVRMEFREGSYCDAVRNYRGAGSDEEIRKKISEMLDKIAYWKELENTLPLEELVRILLYDTGYMDYCSGLPAGRQRTSNLRLLLEKAEQFEKNNYSGLYGFLSYIEAMKKSGISVGEAGTVGENEDVVRIMTVHKSKGLEFPVVILTGMGRQIRPKGTGAYPSLHKDFAIAMPRVDYEEKWHRKTLLQRAIEAKKAREEFEEEIRILYVAMTRAMDRLIMIGSAGDIEKFDNVIGVGKSFLEMVYAPMRESGECIVIHETAELAEIPGSGPAGARSLNDLLDKADAIRDEEKLRLIDGRLSFEYSYAYAAGVKSKYSATELNHIATELNHIAKERYHTDAGLNHTAAAAMELSRIEGYGDASNPAYGDISDAGYEDISEMPTFKTARTLMQPEFLSEKRTITPARLGTVIHLVMEKLDFRKALEIGKPYVSQVIDGLCSDGLITDEERKKISESNIDAFFKTDVGRRAALSKSLHKEQEFIMQKEIKGVPAIVQGIIDCYFEEDDGIVLIDYKSSKAFCMI